MLLPAISYYPFLSFFKSCDFSFFSFLFVGSSATTPRLFFQPSPQCDELSGDEG